MSAWCSWAQRWGYAHSMGMCLGVLQECKKIKMRKAIFLAALMYSSAAVFGMQDERAVFTDGSKKSTLAEVVKPRDE